MSDLLKLSNVLNENTLAEKLLAKTYSGESYLSRSLTSLRELNSSFVESSKELYKRINEASSKDQENKDFSCYFTEYKDSINKYIVDLGSLVSRFSINMDTLIDACKVMKQDQELLNTQCSFEFEANKYKHLGDYKYPKFRPLDIYHREFDHIGKMMQDLGPIASDNAKMQVIASVHNELSKHMKNKWQAKCMEEISGEDDCKDINCFAKEIRGLFKEDETDTITVDKTLLFTIVETLDTYKQYKDSAIAIADDLSAQMKTIMEEIGSMCYRNDDNVVKIKTNTDGVENKDYKVDSYGMNQFNIFMKAKTNQINQLCSLYLVALSIKMDVIVESLTQQREILLQAKDALNGECEAPVEEPEETVDTNEEDTSDDSSEQVPEEEPVPTSDDSAETEEPEEVPATEEEQPTVDDTELDESETLPSVQVGKFQVVDPDKASVEPSTTTDPEEGDVPIHSDSTEEKELEESTVDLEYVCYTIETAYEMEALNRYIVESILNEADGDTKPTDAQKALGNMADQANAAEKAWSVIIEKLKEVFRKFMNTVINRNKSRIEEIKKNQATIKKLNAEGKVLEKVKNKDGELVKGFTIKQTDPSLLLNTQIPSFNWETLKDKLADKETFEKYVTKLSEGDIGNANGAIDAFRTRVINDDEDKEVAASTKVNDMISYCLEFENNYYKPIENDVKDLDRAKVAAKSVAKKIVADNKTANNTTSNEPEKKEAPETANKEQVENYYFSEGNIPSGTAPDAEKTVGNSISDVKSALNIYFNVCCRFTSVKMTCAQKVFNEYYHCLHGILKYYGHVKDEAPVQNNDQNQEETK